MGTLSVEVRFNTKSAGQGVADALALADKHAATYEGKTCVVQLEGGDPDVEKLLNLVAGLKATKVQVNGQDQKPKAVLQTLFCTQKVFCKGLCKHIRIGYEPVEDFLLRNKSQIQNNQLTVYDTHAISTLSNFLEQQEENEYLLKKDLVREYFLEQVKFEVEFCPKYQKGELEKILEQLPAKVSVKSLEEREILEGLEIPSRERQRPPTPQVAPMRQLVEAFQQAQVFCKVQEHYLRTLFSQIYPGKIAPPEGELDPEQLLLELHLVPEDQKGDFYASLAEVVEKEKQIAYLRKAITYEKDEAELLDRYFALADVLMDTGQIDEAESVLQEANKKYGGDFVLLERLAELKVIQKNFPAALDCLKQALEIAPDELSYIQEEEAFAPLRDLPAYQDLVKKYGSASPEE